MAESRSQELWQRAQKVIPGGVNSPVRAMAAVGMDPLFLRSGRGCLVEDADGNRYIDYVGSWGPLILGHADPDVVAAVKKAAEKGTSFGAPTEAEVLFAEMLTRLVPSLDKVRLVSSGTEATMSALRLARGYTGRDLIVKFDGCYHGHSDGLLVAAGSGLATLGIPSCPGVPDEVAELSISLPYNDLSLVEKLFHEKGEQVAAVIIEPVAGNMGVVPSVPGFLQGIRDICDEYGSLLIFDEVITGFRVALGGAQEIYDVTPDLTTLGKVIGGGLPLGAYGGSADVMGHISPVGPVYQAGTLSGNPLATAAGLKALDLLDAAGVYDRLEQSAASLFDGLGEIFADKGLDYCGNRVGSMFSFFFQKGPVTDWESASKSDTELFGKWYRAMISRGVYLAPSQYECTFVSLAHSAEVIGQTLSVAEDAVKEL
jgi:glutamate-1-semialdehyde 2,1-aminomutase